MLLLGVLQAQAAGVVAEGSFDLLETQVLTSNQASVTFSSLSTYAADYQHLQIRAAVRTSRSSTIDGLKVLINATSAAREHQLEGNGSSVTSASSAGFFDPVVAANTNTASLYSGTIIDFLDPFETTKNKTARALTGLAGSLSRIQLTSGLFTSTDAVGSIGLLSNTSSNLLAGSRFSLYGIKAGS